MVLELRDTICQVPEIVLELEENGVSLARFSSESLELEEELLHLFELPVGSVKMGLDVVLECSFLLQFLISCGLSIDLYLERPLSDNFGCLRPLLRHTQALSKIGHNLLNIKLHLIFEVLKYILYQHVSLLVILL